MKISFACDHGALALREAIIDHLHQNNIEVIDHGTRSAESVDYPDFAHKVCEDIQTNRADMGILVCTTGIGMSMAANKFDGVRAALVHYEDQARLTRQHNHANVLCLGAMHTSTYEACRFIDIFLNTEPEGGRHARRVSKFCSLTSENISN